MKRYGFWIRYIHVYVDIFIYTYTQIKYINSFGRQLQTPQAVAQFDCFCIGPIGHRMYVYVNIFNIWIDNIT